MIKQTEDGKYAVDIRPAGKKGKRFRRSFYKLAEARGYERHVINKHKETEAWKGKNTEKCRLSELATKWYELHGAQLKGGKARLGYLDNLITLMGNPIASKITASSFAEFRKIRLETVSANTANHDLAYLKALINELDRLGEWSGDNPFSKIRKLKHKETELTYLEDEQINRLLTALDLSDSHAKITARVCLSTGSRWGEAATLQPSQVKKGKVTFTDTKNGKSRTLPISPEIETMLRKNAPLKDGYGVLKRVIKQDLDLNLPKGQLSHVLRHSFASHFLINGGDILTLQRVLDHESITTTMRYAHLAPGHLQSVRELNPLEHKKQQPNDR